MYRKDWEGRLKGRRHMEPLWKAAGWNGTDAVTRHEARLVREPLRELRVAGRAGVEQRAILDDPWEFLAREGDVWGSIVGRAEACPGAVDVAWIRRVIPRAGESNRSRWDTDPGWRVVQRADFGPAPLAARRLVRQEQRLHDVEKIDQQLLGLLKTREAILHVDPTGRDLSLAVRDVLRALERELRRRGEDFGQPPECVVASGGCGSGCRARSSPSARDARTPSWRRNGLACANWTRRSTPSTGTSDRWWWERIGQ